jgi:tagatose 6-phosphate kinase
MILTVTLNAALDVTYDVERLSHDEPVRVRTVQARAGGKGINVAMILASLGTPVTATGLCGGHRGQAIRDGLRAAAVVDVLWPIAAESRQTVVAMADDGVFSEYDEPGPAVSTAEWEGFLSAYGALLAECRVVVCAGSLPPGVPDTAYATLITMAHDHNCRVVLDTSGAALRAGVEARPDVVKVSRAELMESMGHDFTDGSLDLTDPESVVRCLSAIGGPAIVTLGAEGAVAVGSGCRIRVRPPPRRGNPVGAGDAFTAGLVCDDVSGSSPRSRLAFAAALSASSVGIAGAGLVDRGLAAELLDLVTVEDL